MAPPDDGIQVAASQSIEINPAVDTKQLTVVTGKVIPNPTAATFEVNLDVEPPLGATYELYDAQGRLLSKQTAEGQSAYFDVSGQSAGVCYLFLKANGGVLGRWAVVKQ